MNNNNDSIIKLLFYAPQICNNSNWPGENKGEAKKR